jgi:hypothetical protein
LRRLLDLVARPTLGGEQLRVHILGESRQYRFAVAAIRWRGRADDGVFGKRFQGPFRHVFTVNGAARALT